MCQYNNVLFCSSFASSVVLSTPSGLVLRMAYGYVSNALGSTGAWGYISGMFKKCG